MTFSAVVLGVFEQCFLDLRDSFQIFDSMCGLRVNKLRSTGTCGMVGLEKSCALHLPASLANSNAEVVVRHVLLRREHALHHVELLWIGKDY